jgi:ribosomal-protein-alanine N-acetyltransferase
MPDAAFAGGMTPMRLGPEDAGRLAAFEKDCFPHPWTEEQFRSCLGGDHFFCYGIELDGRLVAYVTVSRAAGEMEILNLPCGPNCGDGGARVSWSMSCNLPWKRA